jgi:hypothetical protein
MTFCLEYLPDKEINKDVVETMVERIEQEVSAEYPWVVDVRSMLESVGTFVIVVNGETRRFVTNCAASGNVYVCDKEVRGFIDYANQLIMLHPPQPNYCYAHYILMHEILHSIDVNMMNGVGSHDRQKFWGQFTVGSIENRLIKAIEKEIRPSFAEDCS